MINNSMISAPVKLISCVCVRDRGVIKNDSKVFSLLPSAKMDAEGLQDQRFVLHMYTLRFLLDIQVKILNQQMGV